MPSAIAVAATIRRAIWPSSSTLAPSSAPSTTLDSRTGATSADRRAREREQHEHVGERAERADAEDRAAVALASVGVGRRATNGASSSARIASAPQK